MAKTLSQRIADRMAKKQKPSRGAQNRAIFLALRHEIANAIDDGWPVKLIWECLKEEKKINFSYQAFRGYVNQLIQNGKAPPSQQKGSKNQKKSAPAPTVGLKRFKYESEVDKDDLI